MAVPTSYSFVPWWGGSHAVGYDSLSRSGDKRHAPRMRCRTSGRTPHHGIRRYLPAQLLTAPPRVLTWNNLSLILSRRTFVVNGCLATSYTGGQIVTALDNEAPVTASILRQVCG